jgi:hypothetical protein
LEQPDGNYLWQADFYVCLSVQKILVNATLLHPET